MPKLMSPHEYESKSEDMIGRYLENPFGHKEIVVLRKTWWDYYDWLKGLELDQTTLVWQCYMRKPHVPIDEALTWALWHVAWGRQKNGANNPSWLEAAPPPKNGKYDYEIF